MKAIIRVFTPINGEKEKPLVYSMSEYTNWVIRAKERNYVFNDAGDDTIYVPNDHPARNEFIVTFKAD